MNPVSPFSLRPAILVPLLGAVLPIGALAAQSLPFMDAPFNRSYRVRELPVLQGPLNAPYGTVSFNPNDPNRLFIGTNADGSTGYVYEVSVRRGAQGQLVAIDPGTTGPMSFAAPFQYAGMDWHPDQSTLFMTRDGGGTAFVDQGNLAGQVLTTDVSALGFPAGSRLTGLVVVPNGFPGAGRLKLIGTSGQVFDSGLSPSGGLYRLDPAGLHAGAQLPVRAGGQLQQMGMHYPTPGNRPFIGNNSWVLVCNDREGAVYAYRVATSTSSSPAIQVGDPVPGSRTRFAFGLSGAWGITEDPVTGSLLVVGDSAIWLVERGSSCGSFTPFGTGIPGAGGQTPLLSGRGCLRIGQPLEMDVDNAPAGQLGVVNLGFDRLNFPLLGGRLHTSPTIAITAPANARGEARLSVPLPDVPAGIGLRLYSQALYLDPGAPFGLSGSNGLALEVR